MTEQQILDITTYDELSRVDSLLCTDVFCDWCIIDEDEANRFIWNEIENWDDSYNSLGSWLQNIQEGYAWYDNSDYDLFPLCDGDDIFHEIQLEIVRRASREGLLEGMGFVDICVTDCQNPQNNEADFVNIIIEDFNIGDIF